MLAIISITVLLTIVYYLIQLNYQYWEKRGVRGPKPTFLVGNYGKTFLLKQHLGELYTEIYRNYIKDSVVGIFRSFSPLLLIRDPELIKDFTTKSFSHFRDNDVDVDKSIDPIIGKNPFFLKGEEWKTVKATLTAGFTSGKMKWLYPYLESNSKKMTTFLDSDKGATSGEGYEAKELCMKFTLNNVGDVAFGIDAKCFEEDNNFLLQLKKSCKKGEFTDADVTAHAAGFLSDGSDTSATIMSFILFHLSVNPKVQSKLRKEIRKAFEENDNKLPYEVMQFLPYLDGVVNESMRISPPIPFTPKRCTKTYTTMLKETNRSLVIEKGLSIVIPLEGLYNDPEYFEDPDVFMPERFLGANRENIQSCTFMPFGVGPRACLGQRFGTLQVKVGISHIIKNYELTLNAKTKLPLKLKPNNVIVSPIGGLWIDFKKIT